MKANYAAPVNRTRLKKDVLKLAECMMGEREAEIRAEVQDSVAQQAYAVAFWILHREYGWGAKRLQRLKNQIEDEYVLMAKRPMGREYTPLHIRQALKERFGVDFSETQYKEGID